MSTNPPVQHLVDTAAQHGLVGLQTLEAHDQFLHARFGLRVQWSHEAGGSVRGVCGAEETTRIAYAPIGLGGKSGVPGDIPFLLPAYFLTELEAVIDMKHGTIMYMALGVKQDMNRLSTGHVSVSIVEFGDGFHAPATFCGSRGVVNKGRIGPNCRPLMLPARLQWGRWRRLLLRFFTSIFLRGWQIFMEVIRFPQLRDARRLQMRREQLEKQTYELQKQEQKMVAIAAATSSMSTPGQLNICTTGRTTATAGMHHGQGQVLGASAGSYRSVLIQRPSMAPTE